MNREIYTYFDASLDIPHQGEVFHCWYRSWKRRGWEPRLLHPRSWRSHPQRKEMKKAMQEQFPDDPVARARGMALLAIHMTGKPVLFSDYDVINFSLEPCALVNRALNQPGVQAIQGFGAYGVLGTVQLIDLYIQGKAEYCEKAKSTVRIATMDLYGGADWHTRHLVHFSREACRGEQKHLVVESCGRRY